MITQKSQNSSPRKFPMPFCFFHAVFVIIVLEPNTFFEDLLHPKMMFAFERSYITFAMRKSVLDVPVPGSF